MQDEREVKRQKRKQSNRESARRSRLRKQAECEDLGGRVAALVAENNSMRVVKPLHTVGCAARMCGSIYAVFAMILKHRGREAA